MTMNWTAGHNGHLAFWRDDSGAFVCWRDGEGWELYDGEGVCWRGTLEDCRRFAEGLLMGSCVIAA